METHYILHKDDVRAACGKSAIVLVATDPYEVDCEKCSIQIKRICLALKASLIQRGYDVRIAYGGLFDIRQDGRFHLLSTQEAVQLDRDELNHPLCLMDYASDGGLNRWYNFEVKDV